MILTVWFIERARKSSQLITARRPPGRHPGILTSMMSVSETRTPVVVLNAYTHCGVTLIRSLGRIGVPVYAVHETRKAPSLRSKYCRGVFELSISELPRDVAVDGLLVVA